jgi:hypothetical protein
MGRGSNGLTVGALTRRDLLTAFLGVPLASAACKRKDKRIPDGEIAFRPEELGHRIRDEAPPEIGADKWEKKPIVIIGGGVAGLSAAWRLREAGVEDFVLLELESAPGGTARSGANATSAYPWAAHYITAPMKENDKLLALLESFQLVEGKTEGGEPIFKEELLCREPQERVFADGAWHDGLYLHEDESDEDKAQFSRFRATIDRFAGARDAQGRRAFAVPVATSSEDAEYTELDRITMAEWMKRERFTSPRLLWLVDYACRDDFGARATQTSAWAGVHYYASRLIAPGREPQPVLTWPEGNGWLVARMFERVREKARLGLAAIDVRPSDAGVDVVAVGKAPVAAGFRAERVIFAAPQMVAARVLRPWRERAPAHVAAFEYGAWMVANITLSDRPRAASKHDRIMAWDNVVYDSPGLGYVVATHQRGRDWGPTVITYYHPLCDDDVRASRRRLFAASREEWADVALADLERAHPDIRSLATRIDVVRWGHAMARPKPGMFFSGVRTAARHPMGRVHFAHTEQSGVALFEEAFYHGVRAADEVVAAMKQGPS